jgi:glutathione S-transferase
MAASTLRLWGRISSINVRKVVMAAQWLQLPFERIDAGREFGIVTTPDFLAKNPNAMVPLIEDGELALWESNVIIRYLAARHGGARYPQQLAERFEHEMWMDWQQTTLNPAGRDAFVQLIRVAPDKQRSSARSPPPNR